MNPTLHLTSGDIAGDLLRKSDISGDVFVWHDILYDGRRNAGWPTEQTFADRVEFLENATGGGLSREKIRRTLDEQYVKLKQTVKNDLHMVLWFDACLFDQTMLCHILACLESLNANADQIDLLCVDHFAGVEPYNGLGQLTPEQLASVFDQRRPVSETQFQFAIDVDHAFAKQNLEEFKRLANIDEAPIPWVPTAVRRWLEEIPDSPDGLGKLIRLALEVIRSGVEKPTSIFTAVAKMDSHPQYWGDTTLWAKINALADSEPPFVHIEGPAPRLPLWPGTISPDDFSVKPRIND